ncbi:MAG: hypothetical protein NTV34_06855 [Proteobacteria bacterium]|nr:hypothetical protein [Pseudomonadota bacterium]
MWIMYGKIQKLRFAAMAVSMGLAAVVFFMGALWLTSIYDGIDKVRMDDAGREIRSRVAVTRNILLADMSVFQLPEYARFQTKSRSALQMNLDGSIPENFDLYAFYDLKRSFVGGAKRNINGKILAPSTDNPWLEYVPADSSVFDHALSESQTSGFLLIDGRPMVLGLKAVKKNGSHIGFALGGRRLDLGALMPVFESQEKSIDIFAPDSRETLPADVEDAMKSMVGGDVSFQRLLHRGAGLGYLRFADVFEETAFYVRFKWSDGGISGERKALAGLFVCAMIFGGLVHLISSGLLTWSVRKRRQTPGLAGLTEWEFKTTVESFPGYAFALDGESVYLGVSRSLAGYFGKECSDFVRKSFGDLSESGIVPAEVFENLRKSPNWPAVLDVSAKFSGLGQSYDFEGTAHLILHKKIVLYILRPKITLDGRIEKKRVA